MEKKKLTQIGITGILIAVLLLAVNSCMHRLKRAKPAAKQAAPETKVAQNIPAAAKAPAPAAGAKPLYQVQEEEGRALESKRNPFEAIITQAPKPPPSAATINLTGILWDKEKPMAIINGKIVKAGDRAAGCSVVEIKENSVVLNDGAKEFVLKLGR